MAVTVNGESIDNIISMTLTPGIAVDPIVDHLGSVHAWINTSTGEAIQKHSYSAYGEHMTNQISTTLSELGMQKMFTGREYDTETDLLRYRARYYDPQTGRFLSEDPIGITAGDTNRYNYVKNNPLKYVDSLGLSPEDVSRLKNVFDQSVQNMNQQGLRRPGSGTLNGMINNVQSTFGGQKLGCGAQADQTLNDIVTDVMNNGQFQDNWQFQIVNPNPFHQNIEATSSNPADPVLTIDPWKNSFNP